MDSDEDLDNLSATPLNFIYSEGLLYKSGEVEEGSRSKSAGSAFLREGSLPFKSAVKRDTTEVGDGAINLKNYICSKKCKRKCSEVLKNLSVEETENFKNKFISESKLKIKSKLLNHLMHQRDIGIELSGYALQGHTYCIGAFSDVTKISQYVLLKVLRDCLGGVQQYVHGNEANPRESIASVKFATWMISFSELYGQAAPDELTTVLPSWLTKAALFKIYLLEAPAPHVKQSNFYKLFKSKFGYLRSDASLPHIRISKFSTHSICSQCIAIAAYQKTCKTELELEFCKSLKFKHKECYGLARRKICELQEMARAFPKDHLFLSIDGM